MTFLYVLIPVALIGLWFIGVMNGFKVMEVKINEADSGIDVALTKRFDTLTKMWDLAKKYMEHESGTLEKVIAMRQAGTPTVADKQAFNNEMSKLQAGINVVVEQYPDLKANTNMQEVQSAVLDVEEHLQAARRLYNANVSTYNQKVVVFPQSIVAGMINATRKDFFEVDEAKREDVSFN
jgi:LemA protein